MKRLTILIIIYILYLPNIFGIVIGNPSDPRLFENGLISSNLKNFSVRASYLYNNIYKAKFEDKFKGLSSTPSDIQMKIIAGVLTFNLFNRLDIYAIAGSSNLKIDTLISTDRHFAWGAGSKLLLYKSNTLDCSLDGKYFSTIQKTDFFTVDKQVYRLKNSFNEAVEEYQASLAISYLTNFLVPYIAASFTYATITPNPKIGYLILPDNSLLFFQTSDSVIKNLYGVALGISVLNKKYQANLNLETRLIDQNSFCFVGSCRF